MLKRQEKNQKNKNKKRKKPTTGYQDVGVQGNS